MELNQAKQIINSAIDVALQKGCYSLADAQAIIQALEKINGLDDVEFGEITPIEKK
jgi:hypothetical protein